MMNRKLLSINSKDRKKESFNTIEKTFYVEQENPLQFELNSDRIRIYFPNANLNFVINESISIGNVTSKDNFKKRLLQNLINQELQIYLENQQDFDLFARHSLVQVFFNSNSRKILLYDCIQYELKFDYECSYYIVVFDISKIQNRDDIYTLFNSYLDFEFYFQDINQIALYDINTNLPLVSNKFTKDKHIIKSVFPEYIEIEINDQSNNTTIVSSASSIDGGNNVHIKRFILNFLVFRILLCLK